MLLAAFVATVCLSCETEAGNSFVNVSGIIIAPNALELNAGETATLRVTIGPENATDKTVSWYCDDSDYISLDISKDTLSATIRIADGANAGTATVTATANSDRTKRATCTVTINPASQVNPPDPSIASLNGTYIFGDTTLTLRDGKVFDAYSAEVGTVRIGDDGSVAIQINDTIYSAARTPGGKIDTTLPVGIWHRADDTYETVEVVDITNGNTGGNQGGSGETTCAHEWREDFVTKEPTETEDGLMTYTCTKCGGTKTEAIPALGHEHTIFYDVWTSDESYHWHAASCENPNHYSEKSEHTWGDASVKKEPTCTETGAMTFTCTVCKNATKDESIEATGHSTVAVLTDDGEREEKCSVCDATIPNSKAPWTSANISKLSDALKNYAGTNAKVKVIGYIQSDVFTSSMKYIIKALRENESKQVALDLSEANHYYKLGEDTDSSFAGCTNLVSMTIPNGVRQIDSDTFEGCTGLERITIPKDVEVIQWKTFRGCNNLKNIVVDANNTKYCAENGIIYTKDKKTLYAYPSASGNVSIPEGVAIEQDAFHDCTNLESVDIPSSVTKIEQHTFSGCTNLKSVKFPDSMKYIAWYAFSGCTSLKSVKIPNDVDCIDVGVFKDCSSLESVEIPSSVEGIVGSSTLLHAAFDGCTNLKTINYNSTAENWVKISIGKNAIPSGVKVICTDGTLTTD